jgi:hypothetical protein
MGAEAVACVRKARRPSPLGDPPLATRLLSPLGQLKHGLAPSGDLPLDAPQLAAAHGPSWTRRTVDGTGDRLALCAYMDAHLGVHGVPSDVVLVKGAP